jgi:hypothetical protein
MLKIYNGKTSPFQIRRSIPRRYLPSTPFENPKNLFSSTFISHVPSQTQNFSKDIIVISPTHESQNILTALKILSLSLSLSLSPLTHRMIRTKQSGSLKQISTIHLLIQR